MGIAAYPSCMRSFLRCVERYCASCLVKARLCDNDNFPTVFSGFIVSRILPSKVFETQVRSRCKRCVCTNWHKLSDERLWPAGAEIRSSLRPAPSQRGFADLGFEFKEADL